MAVSTKAATLKTTILGPLQRHSASVIFLHGSGTTRDPKIHASKRCRDLKIEDPPYPSRCQRFRFKTLDDYRDTGDGVLGWIRSLIQDDFRFPHIKVIFPTAPTRPYTPAGGALSTVWYDRKRIAPNVPEHLETIDPVCEQLGEMIAAEVADGIPKSRIILGGFSMGGGTAMHLAYRFHHDVAGVFALSSFLNNDSVVYKAIQSQPTLPPLFSCHGLKDPLVLSDWGKETVKQLSDRRAPCEYHTFPGLYHEMSAEELHMLIDWIKKQVPDRT